MAPTSMSLVPAGTTARPRRGRSGSARCRCSRSRPPRASPRYSPPPARRPRSPTHKRMLFRISGGNLAARDHVGNGEAPAGLQHAEGLAQDAVLVRRQVDHAVGNDHVHRVVGQRDVLDLALQELDVLDARLPLVLARQGQHLVGHVEAVGLAAGRNPPGRQQHVDAAAAAQVQHRLARLQLGQGRRIAAAQRSQHRRLGQFALLLLVVQIR